MQIRDQTDTVQGKKNEPASNETAEFNVQYIHKRFDTRLRAYSLVVWREGTLATTIATFKEKIQSNDRGRCQHPYVNLLPHLRPFSRIQITHNRQ